MIDTIKISHDYLHVPSAEDLMRRGWQRAYVNTSKTSWHYKEQEGGQYPYLSLFAAPDGVVYLSVTVSLPAFYFGSNVRLLKPGEAHQAFDKLSDYVTEHSGLVFDARVANVWNVDFTKDFFIGEQFIRRAISQLGRINIPRFNKGGYSDTTLYFHSKGTGQFKNKPRTICIYGKYEECQKKLTSEDNLNQAEGMLRLEIRYRTTVAVKRLVNKLELANREAQTVFTEVVSDTVLAPIAEYILLLSDDTHAPEPLFILKEKFGKRRVARLIMFLTYLERFGADFYKIESLGVSRSAYFDCAKACREAGVHSLSSTSQPMIAIGDIT